MLFFMTLTLPASVWDKQEQPRSENVLCKIIIAVMTYFQKLQKLDLRFCLTSPCSQRLLLVKVRM